jgi:glycosyltransferase involved in cell wall biosynthesis
MKKKVLVDARMIGGVGHGIGNYVLDMAAALTERDLPFELTYLVAKGSNSPLRNLPHRDSAISFLHPLEAWRLPKELEGFHLFHSPSFMSLASYPCAHVQTVHDLNHLHYGSLFHKLYYQKLLFPSLQKAKAVISVSETAAKELRDWLWAKGEKKTVEVVPNAIAEPAPAEKGALENLGLKNFFFCLSNPKPHKNITMLEAAHAHAWDQGGCLPLALSTGETYQEGIFRTGPLEPARITALFQGAKAFFFPSLYEGFGRPPLEAVLAGCAPVVSDIPVHREVLGGVKEAEFLDPRNTKAWEEAFLRHSKEERVAISPQSRDWIRETYSRQKLGDRMEKIFREALK